MAPDTPKSESPPRDWAIGARVVDEDGFFATVRYVGPVKSAKNPTATYIGVEWDDPSRGKHNGTVPSKDPGPPETYFVTKMHPNAGSFVLPKKLMRGRTFSEALAVAEYPPCTPIHAILKSMRVDRAGGGHTHAAPPREGGAEAQLAFINLEDNLLSTFTDAFEIALLCPQLAVLRLGKNRLELPPRGLQLPRLEALDSLTLTVCAFQSCWPALVAALSPALPKLRELSLAGNPDLFLVPEEAAASPTEDHVAAALSAVSGQVKKDSSGGSGSGGGGAGGGTGGGALSLPLLQVLELSNTGLTEWAQAEALGGQCPRLTTLGLAHNKLRALAPTMAVQVSPLPSEGAPPTSPPPPTPPPQAAQAAAAKGGAPLPPPPPPPLPLSPQSSSNLNPQPLSSLVDLSVDFNLVSRVNDLLALSARFPTLQRFGFAGNPLVKQLDRRRADRLVLPALPPALAQLDGRDVTEAHRATMSSEFLVAALRASVPLAVTHLRKLEKQQQEQGGGGPGPCSAEDAVDGSGKGNSSSSGGGGGGDDGSSSAQVEEVAIPRLEDFVEMGPPSKGGAVGEDDRCLALQAMQAALAENEYFHFSAVAASVGMPQAYQRLLDR